VTGTVQAVVNVIDFGMDPVAAVSAPRLHAQFVPDVVYVERDVPKDVLDGLRGRGHTLSVDPGQPEGAIQIVERSPAGLFRAGADPRKGGVPAANQ
jgi:gamma-glutamyltranspeptidase/glutathione hydrolase